MTVATFRATFGKKIIVTSGDTGADRKKKSLFTPDRTVESVAERYRPF